MYKFIKINLLSFLESCMNNILQYILMAEYWYRTAKAAPIIVDWIVECIGQYKLFKLASYIQCLSLQDFYAIGYPRELVEEEEYSDDET